MKIRVIGLATSPGVGVDNWESGLKYAGLDYSIYGLNSPYTGHKMKTEKYLQGLEDYPDVDLFIFSDIYDVFINKPKVDDIRTSGLSVEEYIIQIYEEYDSAILVGAELACLINCVDFSLKNLLNPATGNYRFLNSGLWMGRREIVRQTLELMRPYKDDQIALGTVWKQNPELITLEYNGDLFYNNLSYGDEERLARGLFLHFPGLCNRSTIEKYNEVAEKQDYISVAPTSKKSLLSRELLQNLIQPLVSLLSIFPGDRSSYEKGASPEDQVLELNQDE